MPTKPQRVASASTVDPTFRAVGDRQVLQAILVTGIFAAVHVIGGDFSEPLAAIAVTLPLISLIVASRSAGSDRSANWLSICMTISVAITAWQVGPHADLQWLLFANVAVFFLAFEERHPSPQAIAIGLNAGAFAAFTALQQTNHWEGVVSERAQHAISWATRVVALVDLLWMMRHFLQNDRRYREAELRLRDEGWRAASQREAFFADMCHEIRTPLVALTHVHEVLLKTPRAEDERRLVEQALAAGDHLVAILNDGLDLARMDAGRLEIDRRPFSVAELIDETVELWRAMAGARDVAVLREIDLGRSPVRVGDRRRLKQVLYNLVNNALKFTERGSVRVVCTSGAGDEIIIRVIDTGVGMTPDQLQRVFDTFVQGDTTGESQGGSGLGLAISRRLAQLFGGRLEAFSAVHEGSEFRLTLPMPIAALSEIAEVATPQPSKIGPLRVLLAEDTVVNQWVIRRMLEELGHAVEVVADGRSAVASWREHQPDAILMDVQMPVMDGLSATRRIRAQELPGQPEVPILALTGHALPSEVEQCLASGMTGHLAKPVHLRDLQMALETSVREARHTIKARQTIEITSSPN